MRVKENRHSCHEEEREEMAPAITGIAILVPAAVGIGLGLMIRSALSDSEVPFEPSQEAIERVAAFENEDGIGFGEYHVRGSVLSVVLTAAPWAEIPEDLDPSDLPSSMPYSPEDIIDYLEENILDKDITDKQAAKIRKEFARLEKEWDEKDEDKDDKSGKSKSGESEDDEDDDLDEETEAS